MGEPLRISDAEIQAGSELPLHFLRQHLPAVLALVYRIVERVDEAQELTQETFIRALQDPRRAHDLRKVALDLPVIASDLALAYLRRVRPCALAPGGAELPGSADSLAVLPAAERAVLLVRDGCGVSVAEIAKGLRCSRQTVRQLLAKARRTVQQTLRTTDGGTVG